MKTINKTKAKSKKEHALELGKYYTQIRHIASRLKLKKDFSTHDLKKQEDVYNLPLENLPTMFCYYILTAKLTA
jgi:hypothetical protein